MKKTQVVLAVLALVGSSAALAQVTLYGTLDAAIAKGSDSSTGLSGAGQWSASVLGVRGSEDLGNGLKAHFNLEAGINSQDGSRDNGGPNGQTALNASTTTSTTDTIGVNGLFNRAANVGLSGGFGTVTAGLQVSPFIVSYVSSLAMAGNNFLVPTLANGNALDGGGSGQGATGGFFIPNAISYTSNDFGGISASVMTATGNSAETNKYTGGRLVYTTGDLMINAAIANRTDSYNNMLIGGTYTMGPMKLAASYINSQDKTSGGASDIKTTTLGGSYALGGGNTVGANLSRASQSGTNAATIANLSFAHALSKSTTLYAFYNNTKNSALSSYYNTTGDQAYGVGINKGF